MKTSVKLVGKYSGISFGWISVVAKVLSIQNKCPMLDKEDEEYFFTIIYCRTTQNHLIQIKTTAFKTVNPYMQCILHKKSLLHRYIIIAFMVSSHRIYH